MRFGSVLRQESAQNGGFTDGVNKAAVAVHVSKVKFHINSKLV